MLQKIVWCEARGEDLKGQILVANVVLNRVKSKGFPDNIKDVIFQTNQFEPTRDGSFEKAAPTAVNIQAVDSALGGTDHSRGALYFRAIKGADEGWHETALKKLFDWGNHRFYR